MRRHFDPTILQSKTTTKMVLIIKDLNKIIKSLKQNADNKEVEEIDLSNFVPGVYNLQIEYRGLIVNHRVIKQ